MSSHFIAAQSQKQRIKWGASSIDSMKEALDIGVLDGKLQKKKIYIYVSATISMFCNLYQSLLQ